MQLLEDAHFLGNGNCSGLRNINIEYPREEKNTDRGARQQSRPKATQEDEGTKAEGMRTLP